MDTDPLLNLLQAHVLPAHINEEVSIPLILLTIFLVLLNGFFVAAEFAIVKVRSSQIEVQTGLSKGLAGAAKSIVNHLDAYLAATQLGITLASLGLGAVGERSLTPVIIGAFELLGLTSAEWKQTAANISFPLAFAIITILHIVFGELAPKSLAIRFPTKTTFSVAWPLKVFYIVFRPLIWLMNGLANFILRIVGIKPLHGSEIHSEEELKMIISESHEGGAIEETERALIQNVFDFDDRRVSNIQTLRKNISAVEISLSVKEAIDFAIQEGYSRYPVYEEDMDNIKGILYTKDLIRHMLDKPDEKRIEPLLRKATYISESAKIKNVLKEFQTKHIQMAIVTNEIGELTGIVTMEDILEELVGEIQDEYDNEKPIVEKTGENTYLVNAHHPLSDINKYIPFRLEEGEHFETLAGLIAEYHNAQELKEGDKLQLNEYDAVIVKMYRNSAETVELRVREEVPEN
jgi:CBS domain containing-hemolysin-like protein